MREREEAAALENEIAVVEAAQAAQLPQLLGAVGRAQERIAVAGDRLAFALDQYE